ncbi:hypothetical protein WS46_10130 [Burkholderia sp. RF4-BP95]|nr:hypothetical protein WS46_10130 [Burkholderia sp. RF4-BP95]
MRAINGTLRAAAPIRRWIGPRAGFAARVARERLEGLSTPPRGAASPIARTTNRRATAMHSET